MKNSLRLTPLLCVLSILVAGCASAASGAHRHVSGELRWGVVGAPDVPTLDPALASDSTSLSVVSLIYGGLVRLDSHLRVRPDGAARWTISQRGTVYTFYLRHNLRFASGRRVTASDFALAIRRSLGPEGAAGAAPFYLRLIAHSRSRIRGIEVVNPGTLRITLSRSAAYFLAELAFPYSYVPDLEVVGRYGPNWTDHAAGFGPFSVRLWRHGRYLLLQRNPHYYGGKPALKRIVLRFYLDQRPAVAAYQRGSLDLVSGLQAGETIAPGASGKLAGVRRVPGLALDYLAFNTKRLPFYRLHARESFASVWSPRMAASTMGNTAFPASGFLPPAFGIASTRWHPSQAAATYLARARYPHARGFPHLGLVILRDPHLFALATALSRVWHAKLGVDVAVRELNPSNYSAVLNARAFDLAIVRWGADYPDPQNFLATQLGSSTDNITGWVRTKYDKVVTLADSYRPTDPRRIALFRQAADLAALKLAILPLDEPAQSALISPDLANVELTPLGTITGVWTRAVFAS